MTDSNGIKLTGRLLIATPEMSDPRFQSSVIYICSHDENGAMGIIINKQVVKGGDAILLSDMLDNVGIEGDVQVANTPVLEGGPVDIDRGFVLHSSDYFKDDSSLKLSDTLSLTSTKDVLESLVKKEAPTKAMLAVGYSGWGAGQIEGELKDNAWIVADADEAIIFDIDLDGKWIKALATLGIKPEMLSHSGGSA